MTPKKTGLLAPLACLALPLMVFVTISHAAIEPRGTLTVCLAGPPACDYQTVQAAINAAGAGDTVLVEPGVYSGALSLKSNVSLVSSGGPGVTTITAVEGPILAAHGVVSASVEGLSVSGAAVVTNAVGIDLDDSQIRLVNCVIHDLYGPWGAPEGQPATAIRAVGSGSLAVIRSTIGDLGGGSGLCEIGTPTDGADVMGIVVTGPGQLTVQDTVIHYLSGGQCGYSGNVCGAGGSATAIRVSGDVDLTVERSQISHLSGASSWWTNGGCVYAGSPGHASGIQATGGTVELRDNHFSDLIQPAGGYYPKSAIDTSSTRHTYIERNTITMLPSDGRTSDPLPHAARLAAPCPPSPLTVIPIASAGDAQLYAADNLVSDLYAEGSGHAAGFQVSGAGDVVLHHNAVVGVYGGDNGANATGFHLA